MIPSNLNSCIQIHCFWKVMWWSFEEREIKLRTYVDYIWSWFSTCHDRGQLSIPHYLLIRINVHLRDLQITLSITYSSVMFVMHNEPKPLYHCPISATAASSTDVLYVRCFKWQIMQLHGECKQRGAQFEACFEKRYNNPSYCSWSIWIDLAIQN